MSCYISFKFCKYPELILSVNEVFYYLEKKIEKVWVCYYIFYFEFIFVSLRKNKGTFPYRMCFPMCLAIQNSLSLIALLHCGKNLHVNVIYGKK